MIPRGLNFMCRPFGTLSSIFIGGVRKNIGYSKTSARKIQMRGNHPKERMQYSEQSDSLKWRRSERLDVNS